MQILSKRRFTFIDWLIIEKGGERLCEPKQQFQVHPQPTPQFAPDWIQQDKLFELAITDGNLKVLSV